MLRFRVGYNGWEAIVDLEEEKLVVKNQNLNYYSFT
jgi:hypothetical protein